MHCFLLFIYFFACIVCKEPLCYSIQSELGWRNIIQPLGLPFTSFVCLDKLLYFYETWFLTQKEKVTPLMLYGCFED